MSDEMNVEYEMSEIATDFVAAHDMAQPPQTERESMTLQRGELYTLNVESIANGSNDYGDWTAINTTNGQVVFFNGFESKDVLRAHQNAGSPDAFDMTVVRVLKDSVKNPGRSYSAAVVTVFPLDA